MAYDEELADRLRAAVSGQAGVTEQKMFGGLAFMIRGNMAVAAGGRGGLLLRVAPEQTETLAARTHADRFVMRGRAMTGWLRIEPEGIASDEHLAAWVAHGIAYAGSLPPK